MWSCLVVIGRIWKEETKLACRCGQLMPFEDHPGLLPTRTCTPIGEFYHSYEGRRIHGLGRSSGANTTPLPTSSRLSVSSPRTQSTIMMTHSQLLPTLKPIKTYLVRNDMPTYPAHSSVPSFRKQLQVLPALCTRVPTSHLLLSPIFRVAILPPACV